MRILSIISLVLMSVVSFPSWGLTMDDLVKRAGIYYEKFTTTPFTGKVDEGLERGSFRNGKKDGSWEIYYDNGQLLVKGDYKNGKKQGYWESYWDDGKFGSKGDYKDGKRDGPWEIYYDNGQLWSKGDYTNNERQGYWEYYYFDGTVSKPDTAIYKNDVRVID
jgi:hypothetical protein